jgi:hypothetical protein|tara:strand:+ start:106 stop:657 length:552 start_codon:yes stop_codon:yes gene_type:complete
MPSKKKKQKSLGSGGLIDLFKDRGKGLENFIREELQPNPYYMKTFKDLAAWCEKMQITPAAAYEIIENYLYKDKNARQNFLQKHVIKNLRNNRNEIHFLLDACKKYGTKKIFYREDELESLDAFERTTFYKAPRKIKTFEKDLTIMRTAVGKKRSRDGSYGDKQVAESRARKSARELNKLLSK